MTDEQKQEGTAAGAPPAEATTRRSAPRPAYKELYEEAVKTISSQAETIVALTEKAQVHGAATKDLGDAISRADVAEDRLKHVQMERDEAMDRVQEYAGIIKKQDAANGAIVADRNRAVRALVAAHESIGLLLETLATPVRQEGGAE